MATGTLTSTTIAATYKSLLKVKGGANQVLEAGSTAHYLEDGDGNDSVLALSQAFVGIGTEAPLALLSVGAIATLVTDGTTAVTPEGMNVHITEASKYAMGIKNADASGDGLIIQAGDASDDFALRVEDYDSANDLLVVQGDGKVGIGIAAPARLLSVVAPGSAYPTIQIADSDLGVASSDGFHLQTYAGDAYLWNAEDGHLQLATNNTAKMTILANGNVGIGDTSPDAHLDIEDTNISTADGYTGLAVNHTKTGGASTDADSYYGINSNFTFSDADAGFGSLYGANINITSALAVSSNEADNIRGLYIGAGMAGDTAASTSCDVTGIYGAHIVTDIDAGTVDSNVWGQRIEVDIESSGITLSNWVHGIDIDMDVDTDPAGDGVALRVKTNGNYTNWAFLHENSGDNEIKFTITGDGYWDGAADNGAADYAEYFESTDGSVIPIGNTVVLESGKIRQAADGETPIGIIRPHDGCAVVGNSAWSKWQEKYLKDDYGTKIMESHTKTKWSEEITFDEYVARGKDETGGSMGGQVKDEKVEGSKATYYKEGDELPEGKEVGDVKEAAVPDTYFREHKYHSDRIPEGLEVPEDAEVFDAGQRQKLNPDFDESFEYVPREERDEWHIVGLLGQIPITKGQPTGNWIKMSDVSDTVEMYFVK